jgi:PAS domain S-box-containing protein
MSAPEQAISQKLFHLKVMPMSSERHDQSILLQPLDSASYDRGQVAFAKTLSILLIAGPIVMAAILLAAGEPDRLRGTIPFAVFGMVGLVLLRRGTARLAFQILVYGIWACAVNALFWSHGLTGTTFGGLVIVLAFAGWLAGPTAAIILTAATPPLLFLLAHLEVTGWPIAIGAVVTPYQRAMVYSITALAGGALGYFGAASLRERLTRLLQSERDLSARLAELQQSEQKFSTVLNMVPDGIVVTRRSDAVYTEMNAASERLLGYPRDRVLGHSARELGIWADPVERATLLSRLESHGAVDNFPARFVRADGQTIEVLVSAVQHEISGEPCIVWSWSDIRELRAAEREAQFRQRVESLLLVISSRFLNAGEAEVDAIILDTLREIGEFAEADRCFVMLLDAQAQQYSVAHEWCADGIEPKRARRQNIPITLAGSMWGHLARNEVAYVAVADLPIGSATSAMLEAYGIKSSFAVPMVSGGHLVGCLGFDAVRQERRWADELIVLMRVAADILGGVLARRRAAAALRASEDKFAKAFRSSPMFISISTLAEGRYIEINDVFERMLGHTRAELIGRTSREIGLWKNPQDRQRAIDALVENGHIGGLEAELCKKSGELLICEIWAEPIEIEGKPCVIWVTNDITARKRAEVALKRESHRYEVLLHNSSDGVHILDADGNVLEVSDSFCEMLGYSREELLGANASLWDAKWSRQELKQKIAEQIAQEGNPEFETMHRHRDGSIIEVEVTTQRLELDGNLMLFNSARNITERKRAAQALRESETRLSTIFQASPIGISVSRLSDGKILDVNDAALRIHGYTRDEAIGRRVSDLGVYANPVQRQELVAQLREQGSVDRFPVDYRRKNGKDGVLEMSARVIELQNEQCAMMMMVDISERKRLQAVHLQAQKLESLGTLTGGIAHDFNNILSAIQGNADLAAEDAGRDHPATQSIEEIRKASARASELVRRIMAFGRPSEVQHKQVNLSAVIDEVLKLLRSTLPAGISLRKDFADDTPQVLADAGQIHEVIVNLTTNAAYAIGPRAGSIKYRLGLAHVGAKRASSVPGLKEGDYARLTVTDSGCGMDAATIGRIFDAFYTTKPVGVGTGLGLSMVHGIMKSHGGTVTVESTPGKGSRFTLYFPASRENALTEEAKSPAPSPLTTGCRVLYVDDEEALVLLAGRVLARLGHHVDSHTDPREALEVFRADPQKFDIVVTDLSMPHMSGFEFARDILALRPGIPVLIATGYLRAEDDASARAIGVREVILKPTTMDEFGRVLDRLCRDS